MKSEKVLGLPPIELAERTTYINKSDRTISQNICIPWLKKIIYTIIVVILAIGGYMLLSSLFEIVEQFKKTEITLISGPLNNQNLTIESNDVDIFIQIKNKTLRRSNKRKRRSLPGEENTRSEEKNNILLRHDNAMKSVREFIMNHNTPCDNSKSNEICKGLVQKIESIVQAIDSDTNMHQDMTKSNSELPYTMTPTNNPDKQDNSVTKRHTQSHLETGHKNDQESEHVISNDIPLVQNYFNHQTGLREPSSLTDTCLLARLIKQNPNQIQGVFLSPNTVNGFSPQPYVQLQIEPHLPHRVTQEGLPDIQDKIHVTPFRTHPQDVDIVKQFHTERSNKTTRGKDIDKMRDSSCEFGTLPCDDGEICIDEKHWCDGVVHCLDTSDETRCSCRERIDKSRLCDGYFDCPSGEDETGCNGCAADAFSCEDLVFESQSTCFAKEERCDNVINCPNRKDEIECSLLAPSLHEKPVYAMSHTEGFLQRNYRGTWYPVCENPYMWAHDACLRETGLIIRPPFIQMFPIDPTLSLTYLNTGPGFSIELSEGCSNSSAVYVTCPDLLCGTRLPTTPQLLRKNSATVNNFFGRNKRFLERQAYVPRYRRQLLRYMYDINGYPRPYYKSNAEWRWKRAEGRVVGGRPSEPAAWPWMVALYRNGIFHCGGVVVSQIWIVSAAHCVHRFWENYYEVQVGMLRRFSYSPQESNHRVTNIIVNQKYNRVDMNNDLSLLRVKPSIQFSRWVRPICLPNSNTAGPNWLKGPEPGTICTAVGWGATVEHGPDPDHLREVEVPIWAQCNHREDRAGHEICAGPAEGGKDACQGDSGGPLLCRNPLNPRQWYMAGIVSHGDGCARKGEPGVYTRVSMFTKWLHFHMFSKDLPSIQPKQECPGFKCLSGIRKCLPKNRMCDRIVDCLDGEDEINCNFMRSAETNEALTSESLHTGPESIDENDEIIVSSTTIPTITEQSIDLTTEGIFSEKIVTTDTTEIFANKIAVSDESNSASDEKSTEERNVAKRGDIGLQSTESFETNSDSTDQTLIDFKTTTEITTTTFSEEVVQNNSIDVNNVINFNHLSPHLSFDDEEIERKNMTLELFDELSKNNQSLVHNNKSIGNNFHPANIVKKHRIPKTFECRRIFQKISFTLRCNHKADCEDGTDEQGCSCVDYLTTFDQNLLCDGLIDCADGLDETNCFGCPENEFLCKRSQMCLPTSQVCDDEIDCPEGEDELDCYSLTNGKNIVIDLDGRPKVSLEGFFTKKHNKRWNIVCEDSLPVDEQETVASRVCRYLGFSSANRFQVKYINIKDENVATKNEELQIRDKRDTSTLPVSFMYRAHENDILMNDPQIIKEQCVPNVTKTCMSLYVSCDHMLFTDFSLLDIDEDVTSLLVRSSEQIWPWLAKVNVEGGYKCSGILVDFSWVLVSQSCLWDILLNEHYMTVILGSQRTLKASHGPYEQIYKVDYMKNVYNSKITLLHLSEPAHYSIFVKPMIAPTVKFQSAENDNICVALGEDDKHNTLSVFLEETDENCDLHSRCFKRQRSDPICPSVSKGRLWAGIVSCHGSEGWFPAASFVERNGECGVGDTIVGLDIGKIRNYFKQNHGLSRNNATDVVGCDGHRCVRGDCINLAAVCDGVRDCADGGDELDNACAVKQGVCAAEAYRRGCECAADQLKCKNGKCIKKERFSDGRDDCGDGSDEPAHAACAHYLAAVKPARLCDGVLHCQDRTDEDPLFCKCFSDRSFKCRMSDHCVAVDAVCDGVPDCPAREDEQFCLALNAPKGTRHGTGEVIERSHGVWFTKCFDKQNHTRSELEAICSKAGFISGHARQLPTPSNYSHAAQKLVLAPYEEVALNGRTVVKLRNSDHPRGSLHTDLTQSECYPVFIECL